MKIHFIVIGLLVLLYSCGEEHTDKISGAYARGYEFEQKHFNGNVVGKAHIRDTIIITKTGDGYLVQHHFWRKNDYDIDGWKQRKGSGEQHPAYDAEYDEATESLLSKNGFAPPLFVDRKNKVLRYDKEKNGWRKVE